MKIILLTVSILNDSRGPTRTASLWGSRSWVVDIICDKAKDINASTRTLASLLLLTTVNTISSRDSTLIVSLLPKPALEVAVNLPGRHEGPVGALVSLLALSRAVVGATRLDSLSSLFSSQATTLKVGVVKGTF